MDQGVSGVGIGHEISFEVREKGANVNQAAYLKPFDRTENDADDGQDDEDEKQNLEKQRIIDVNHTVANKTSDHV